MWPPLLGQPLQQVTGSDGIYHLARHSACKLPRLLSGAGGMARPGAAAGDGHPLDVAGTYAGSPADDESAAIIARVRAARPDLLLVAYGVPARKVDCRHRDGLGVPVMMGWAAALILAGVTRRAPPWIAPGAGMAPPADPRSVAPAVGPARFLGLVVAQRQRNRASGRPGRRPPSLRVRPRASRLARYRIT